MRTFRNLAGQDITEEQVLEEVKALFGEDHDADELGTIFTNYINNAISAFGPIKLGGDEND